MEAQVSLTVAFSSSAIVGSGVSHLPLDNTHRFSMILYDSLWGSGQASLLANQAQ